ncbi:malate synthase G [Alteromonas sp. ASW11-130]|uniref:malate synthase G n=1 Tax=Alteromonas sp. ASW11-130 TaxID=3015775 RepID=UPI002241B7AC|nr:malate synthase G [Alteromonas sp. ASW11-130]MCW8091306.1 malate synthase G [Alteromonas sp. ASW11-130]
MQKYVNRGQLKIAQPLHKFINDQALPGSQVDEAHFWLSLEQILQQYTSRNNALLKYRETIQQKLDGYHKAKRPIMGPDYVNFLEEIGYLAEEPENCTISTSNVDDEVCSMAGPQLVVPINNARYALNACNARWGSLYDALYGTNVIAHDDGAETGTQYNPIRGQKVIEKAREWLDVMLPLATGSHRDAVAYTIENDNLVIHLSNKNSTQLADIEQWQGFTGELSAPSSLLFRHNGLHLEIAFDSTHPVGKSDPAGIKDVTLESALSTIMDCEDSVAAVDAEDKVLVYSNWLGLMKGTLSTTLQKNGKSITRTMQNDKTFTPSPFNSAKSPLCLSGRSLMFVRNVGLHMYSDAVLLNDEPVPEGILDGVITSLIGKHDILGNTKYKNSDKGSIYIVKPKMHGPDEVAYTNELFASIEDALGLERFTLKMGIMDEERRTSVNLKACIAQATNRVVFINTGFLDRTGDEIHTSMHAGAFADKADLKTLPWIGAYERSNVATGIACGLSGKAQIGKGMWPVPDDMLTMMTSKISHPLAGATTAWVPSPTAATLHALHYHQVDVFDKHNNIVDVSIAARPEILTIPLLEKNLTPQQIQHELDNNVQGILGYVVRWVHMGIGCSKVPDINHIGLMEDRATLRISSQHIANWLLHGLVNAAQIEQCMLKMASLVDEQNKDDPHYLPMGPAPQNSYGFQAAKKLIMEGQQQPNGYTEFVLHDMRRKMKLNAN